MPAFKSTFLSFLLLTVASGVKGNTTTVTLLTVEPPGTAAGNNGYMVTNVSAIGLDANGGTVYEEKLLITSLELVLAGTPSVTTLITNNIAPVTRTFVEAASWVYASSPDPSKKFNNVESNCTLGTNGTTGKCVEIEHFVENGTTVITTTSFAGHVVPFYTLTVTGPIPTSTNAATILGNPIFNTFSGVFLWIFFVVKLLLDFF